MKRASPSPAGGSGGRGERAVTAQTHAHQALTPLARSAPPNKLCEWVGDPYFFHREHPKHWGPESLAIGTSILADHYDPKYCWDTWRRSMPYSEGK